MNRTNPCARASTRASSAPPAPEPSPTHSRRRGCASGSDRADRRAAARASDGDCRARPDRCGRRSWWRERNRLRCSRIHGPMRSSDSPYDAAVSIWLMPYSSSTSSTPSALSCFIPPSAAAPKMNARTLMPGFPEWTRLDHDVTSAAWHVVCLSLLQKRPPAEMALRGDTDGTQLRHDTIPSSARPRSRSANVMSM